jgi:inner membrane protein
MDYLHTGARSDVKSRSMGLKLIAICALAVLMTIPSLFVSQLVSDRTSRAGEVLKEISTHIGGPQTFFGPTLAVPYRVPPSARDLSPSTGVYLIVPAQALADVRTTATERRRSLFRVPVFQADLKLQSTFDLRGVPAAAPPGAEFDWSHAEMVVGVSDARGAMTDAVLEGDAGTTTFTPSELADRLSVNANESGRLKLVLLGAKFAAPVKPPSSLQVRSTLKFSGAERIAVLAWGKSTHVTVRGDWPSPGFDGAFLPLARSVTDSGFQAEWSVPFTARGVRAEGPTDSVAGLGATGFGVSFIEVADPYQSVSRALKYVLLIVGLVFLAYFVFEVTTGKQVHPAQYILVGLAQIIFYLLLLSFAERIGFDLGFLLSAAATVILLSTNAGWIFSSRMQGARALALFSVLYVLIYFLLRLEDNALLVGAISSFLAVAAAMYLTRRLDWYGSIQAPGVTPQPIAGESSTGSI